MTYTRAEWGVLLLGAATLGFSYSLVTVGTPVLPQYFRDAGIYASENVVFAVINETGWVNEMSIDMHADRHGS